MKKILLIILLLLILFKNSSTYQSKEEIRAIFISYIELQEYISSKSEDKIKSNIDLIINNIKKIKTNTIILQVRSETDSIYKSSIFPTSRHINQELSFDLLNYFIKQSHKNRHQLFLIDVLHFYSVLSTNSKLLAPVNSFSISSSPSISSFAANC